MAAVGGDAMQCFRPFNIMVAVAKNGAIGNEGQLPWPRLRTDLKVMATVTRRAPPGKENAIVIGRKTWFSIPEKNRPLKGRFNVVLTSSPSLVSDAHNTAPSLMEAVKILSTPPLSDKIHEVFILGGSGVYKEALQSPLLDRVYFTDVELEFEGDTFFPDWNKDNFELTEDPDVPKGTIEESGVAYRFLVYKKKPTTQ